jgi:hypothetical protein
VPAAGAGALDAGRRPECSGRREWAPPHAWYNGKCPLTGVMMLNGGYPPMQFRKSSASREALCPAETLAVQRLCLEREGAAHSLWMKPRTGAVEAIPRHTENPQQTREKDLQVPFDSRDTVETRHRAAGSLPALAESRKLSVVGQSLGQRH